jgi:hypothetical protein
MIDPVAQGFAIYLRKCGDHGFPINHCKQQKHRRHALVPPEHAPKSNDEPRTSTGRIWKHVVEPVHIHTLGKQPNTDASVHHMHARTYR